MNMTPVSLGDIPDTLQKLEDTYIIKFDTKSDQNKARSYTIIFTWIRSKTQDILQNFE